MNLEIAGVVVGVVVVGVVVVGVVVVGVVDVGAVAVVGIIDEERFLAGNIDVNRFCDGLGR